MTWTPFIRVVGFARRPRREPAPVVLLHSQERRHSAVAGLDAPPVHGRHCICARCERQSRAAG